MRGVPRPFVARFCVCFVYWFGDARDLHSFPTRRSSDLIWSESERRAYDFGQPIGGSVHGIMLTFWLAKIIRSEEHTSELQSRVDLVCRLLLEKKNDHAHTCQSRSVHNGAIRGDKPCDTS